MNTAKEVLISKRKLLLGIFSSIFFIVLWVGTAKIEIIVTASGAVVPSRAVKTLQNLEGGIVSQIMVRPGDRVRQGDVLAQIDSVQYVSELRSLETQLLGFQVRRDRLRAELDGVEFNPDPKLYARIPELVKGERREFENRRARLESIKNLVNLAESEQTLVVNLAARKLEPKSEAIRASLAVEERKQMLTQTMENIAAELNRSQAEIQTKTELMQSLVSKVERARITAPVNGIVGELYAKTEGVVLPPGGPIMEIIPTDDRLIVEGKIAASDVAKITPGMPANIKLSAYDFSVYGTIPGVVTYISPDISKDPQPNGAQLPSAYVVRVESLGNKKDIELRPGLDATVDIVTGSRTILQYLVSPIERVISNSLRGG